VANADGEVMGRSHAKFMDLNREGKLLSPDVVGKAVAGMAMCKELLAFSGKFVNWDDKDLSGI
jgi:hypothetical protein